MPVPLKLYLKGSIIFETAPLCRLMYIPEGGVLTSSVTVRPFKSYVASWEWSSTLMASIEAESEKLFKFRIEKMYAWFTCKSYINSIILCGRLLCVGLIDAHAKASVTILFI